MDGLGCIPSLQRIPRAWPRAALWRIRRLCSRFADARFVSVEDIVKVNLYFFDHPDRSGIFNLGTGRAQPFNDVAVSVINTRDAVSNTLEALVAQRKIEYIPFPDTLRGKYQCFTQADLTRLRGAGYSAPFLTVQQGVERYVHWLISQR